MIFQCWNIHSLFGNKLKLFLFKALMFVWWMMYNPFWRARFSGSSSINKFVSGCGYAPSYDNCWVVACVCCFLLDLGALQHSYIVKGYECLHICLKFELLLRCLFDVWVALSCIDDVVASYSNCFHTLLLGCPWKSKGSTAGPVVAYGNFTSYQTDVRSQRPEIRSVLECDTWEEKAWSEGRRSGTNNGNESKRDKRTPWFRNKVEKMNQGGTRDGW